MLFCFSAQNAMCYELCWCHKQIKSFKVPSKFDAKLRCSFTYDWQYSKINVFFYFKMILFPCTLKKSKIRWVNHICINVNDFSKPSRPNHALFCTQFSRFCRTMCIGKFTKMMFD